VVLSSASELAALDAAMARGIADAQGGQVMPLEGALARIHKELGFRHQDPGQ